MNQAAAFSPSGTSRGGFRELRVVAKVRESEVITSFYLEPVEPDGWRSFRPGQFLVLRLPAHPDGGHVLRHYSLSGPPDARGRYRISVKREPASGPGLPPGAGSGHLHDSVVVGDVVLAMGPRGDFVLDRESSRPVLLMSGGVGLTPMVAMLHDLAPGARSVTFLHACENGEVHALRDEVAGLVASRPGLRAHFLYRHPTARDRAEGRFHGEGMVTKAALQALLPLDDYDVYLCGPPPFMQATYGTLRALGVPRGRIAFEFFGPATVLEPDAAPATPVPAASVPATLVPATVPPAGPATVEFRRSGVAADWEARAGSLLALAEERGLSPAFSCRAGICGTCEAGLLAGEVEYFEEPLDPPLPGRVLLCCSRPRGPVVIDI